MPHRVPRHVTNRRKGAGKQQDKSTQRKIGAQTVKRGRRLYAKYGKQKGHAIGNHTEGNTTKPPYQVALDYRV
jgi:LytS/YehU family sensor histidine kinase